MAEIINLNRHRKQKARENAAVEAQNNRVTFGRKRSEKEADHRAAAKARTDLDGKKLDDEP